MPIDLTKFEEAVNSGLDEKTPNILVSADKNGYPDVAIKGSMMVFDDQHLAWWERSLAEQIEQVLVNPHVAVLYRSSQRGLFLRFYGDATVHKDGPIREQIMAKAHPDELAKDPERKGFGVMVQVNRVRLAGKTAQERDS